MATQTIECGLPIGTTSVKLFTPGDLTQTPVATSVPSGRFAAFTDVPAGLYRVAYFVSTTEIGYQWVDLTLATATFQAYEMPVSVFAGGVTLTGPYTLTLTIEDDSDDSAIELAKVRLYKTGETETQATDSAGEVEFSVEAATWFYAITANGFSGATGTIVVSGNASQTIQLTANTITPGDADATTGWLVTRDANGDILVGVVVSFAHVRVPNADTGNVFPSTVREFTSDAFGLVECPMIRGGRYNYWSGNQASSEIIVTVIPLSAGDTYELPSLISAP